MMLFLNKHYATYLVDSKKKTLFIELANVCGITLVEQKNLNPLLASNVWIRRSNC